MASIVNVLDTSKIISHTTTKIIDQIEAVADQSINITLSGLNINTNLNLYIDFKLVPSTKIQLRDRPASEFSTDAFGKADFILYYNEDLTQLNDLPEAKYNEFITKNTGKVLIVVVDKASINTTELPSDYKIRARCYAEKYVERSYAPELSAVQNITINEIKQS